MLVDSVFDLSLASMAVLVAAGTASAMALFMFYRLYWHPLAQFPGPWYASCFSASAAVISRLKIEPQWLQSLVKKYGCTCPGGSRARPHNL
jgi:hypothetical protein